MSPLRRRIPAVLKVLGIAGALVIGTGQYASAHGGAGGHGGGHGAHGLSLGGVGFAHRYGVNRYTYGVFNSTGLYGTGYGVAGYGGYGGFGWPGYGYYGGYPAFGGFGYYPATTVDYNPMDFFNRYTP